MKICTLGLGYIGLPTSLLMANAGHDVTGVDTNKAIIEVLRSGQVTNNEPGLQELLEKTKPNFHPQSHIVHSDVFIIAVPTPLDNYAHVADLRFVRSAAEMIVPFLREGDLVVVESTVPPGTGKNVVLPILLKSGLNEEEFYLAHCPERAIPGRVIEEMTGNPRIIGGKDDESTALTMRLYRSFATGELFPTDIDTAEFVKLMENTFRDVNIALANDFAKLAEEYQVDIWEARELANKHPRVDYAKPGPGVGGHCIAIDPWFLMEHSTACKIISVARDINDTMPNYVLKLVRNMVSGIKDPVISVLGVTYKGNVSDTRETPASKFIMLAENDGMAVKCHDPLASEFKKELLDLEEATRGSDCIILLADHDVFKHIDPATLEMRNRNIVDTRGAVDIKSWRDSGFSVKVIGNGKAPEPFLDTLQAEDRNDEVASRIQDEKV